jgi:hypothetical protein
MWAVLKRKKSKTGFIVKVGNWSKNPWILLPRLGGKPVFLLLKWAQ